MVMGEQEAKCALCKEKVAYDRDGQVVCWFIDQPDKKKECPAAKQSANPALAKPSEEAFYSKTPLESVSEQKTIFHTSPDEPLEELAFYQEATHSLTPLHVNKPSPPSNPFLVPIPQPPTSQPPQPVVKSWKRRGVRIFLSAVILALLAGGGLLAYYASQWHSQILSQKSIIASQTAIIQNQSTVIQQGQAALMATIQAQGTVIKNGQAMQKAVAQQLNNLQATSTAVAANTPLGAIPDGQSPYATVSVGQTVFITFTLENTGSSPWSKQGGFSFNCTSNSRHHSDALSHGWTPVCPNPGEITFIDDTTVSNGQSYTFSFYFPTASLSAGTTYAIYWRLAYNSLLFGTEVYELVKVTS